MTVPYALKLSAITIALGLLAACAVPTPEPTPGPTPTPEPSPTATSTPTPTPSPTPTAAPLNVANDLRARLISTPLAQRGAPCGIVDILDFPLGPPDGAGYSARWSFGRYSDRYNGIHAGEDWRYTSGDSLGKPVYSIAHGVVTYAQPLGWGVDRGVVIVRHVFPDGSTFLSFYGHLDPPSVVLRPGDCVQRGDKVGAIGKPRGRPHLHFEIRTHTPDDPGPGYWPVDPTRAGWLNPSNTISDYRIEISPGVEWTRPFTATGSFGIGVLSDGTLAAVDGSQLAGIDPSDGSLRWSRPFSSTLESAVIDVNGARLYVSTFSGRVHALDSLGAPLWQGDFGRAGRSSLMPMPGGGVVIATEQALIGVSAAGQRVWQIDRAAPPFDWALDGDRLIFTTQADYTAVHTLDREGHLLWAARMGGRLVVASDQVFVYNENGVYQINPQTLGADRLVPLDGNAFELGDPMALPDGGLLIPHSGSERRLIALDPDGSLRWDRSITTLSQALPRLFTAGDRVYALTIEGDVLLVDPASGEARLIFDGGVGTRLDAEVAAFGTAEGKLLLDIRGGKMIALDPLRAIEAVTTAR